MTDTCLDLFSLVFLVQSTDSFLRHGHELIQPFQESGVHVYKAVGVTGLGIQIYPTIGFFLKYGQNPFFKVFHNLYYIKIKIFKVGCAQEKLPTKNYSGSVYFCIKVYIVLKEQPTPKLTNNILYEYSN